MGIVSSAHAQWVEPDCDAVHTITGEAAGDQHGWVANPFGDVNGDGISEFISTAPTSNGNGGNSGRVYVYDGATGAELWRRTGNTGWRLGADGDAAGDVDGDGVPDVVVGAPSSAAGRAFVFSGIDGTTVQSFIGEVSGDQFGYDTCGGGDFNGDGTGDLLITAPNNDAVASSSGRAYVYSGTDFSIICTIDGPRAGALFGSGAQFVGDVNADGRDDIVVAARGFQGGKAFVYSWDGSQCNLVHTLAPTVRGTQFGWFFCNGEQDVNADGTPDIYVGDFSANRAWIFSGLDGSVIWELTGNNEGGGFGIGRLIPDINADGHADAVMAAWVSSQGAAGAGKTFVYSGKDATILQTMTYTVSGAGFGFDAAGMIGDVNGDGAFDYLITAASEAGGTGKTFVMAGTVGKITSATLTDVARTLGLYVSGDQTDLIDSDDSYYVLQSGPGFNPLEPHPARIDVGFDTGGFAAATLNVTVEEKANIGGPTAVVLLRNWTTASHDELGRFSLGPVDTSEVLADIPASDYVNGSNRVEVRVRSFAILILNPVVRGIFSHDFVGLSMR